MAKIRISGGLLACLFAVVLQAAPVLFLPGPLSNLCGQDAWLAGILASCGGLGIGLIATWVSVRHPGLGPAQIGRQVLGKWLGSVLGLCFAGFFTFVFSLVLRDVLDFAVIILLPGTPGMVIIVLFAGAALYSVWAGLEPTARLSFQVLLAVALAVAFLPLLEAREYNIKQIDPFLYQGLPALFEATVVALPWFGESMAVMGLIPHLKNPRSTYRWLTIGMGGSAAILTVLVAQTMLVFGSQLPDRFIFPVYYMLQLISIAKIVERVEVILVTIWTSAMFVKASLYLFISAEAAAQSLGVRNYRRPAVVIAVVGVLLTQIWPNILDLIHWNATSGAVLFLLGFEVGIPVVLLLASAVHQAVRGRGTAHA